MTADEQKRRSTSHFGIPSHSLGDRDWEVGTLPSPVCQRGKCRPGWASPMAELVAAQGSSNRQGRRRPGRAAELLGS